VSGQGGSEEAPVSQAERAIIDYLKGSLRGSIGLVWQLVLEDLSLARRVVDEHGESDVIEAVITDMSGAGELCYIASNILDSETLSRLVSADAGRYWGLLSDIMSGLIELRGILIKALPAGKEVDDRAKELSPVIKEKVSELLRGIISELSVAVAKLDDELFWCKKRLEMYEDMIKRGEQEVSGSGQADR
jgi:hypothetical protein